MPINITDSTLDRIMDSAPEPYGPHDDALSWQEGALCAQTGPDFFFPAPGSSTREAKRLCGACEGREACLAYALDHDERFGVWGGLSEKERQRLRRNRG